MNGQKNDVYQLNHSQKSGDCLKGILFCQFVHILCKEREGFSFSPFGAVVSLGDQIKRIWPREQIDIPLSESQEKKARTDKTENSFHYCFHFSDFVFCTLNLKYVWDFTKMLVIVFIKRGVHLVGSTQGRPLLTLEIFLCSRLTPLDPWNFSMFQVDPSWPLKYF